MRRLPVYLVLDCSVSMVGEPIAAVRTGVEQLLRELRKNPHALETVHVSVIGFSSQARQLMPLTELAEAQPPELRLGPGTALSAALTLLRERIDAEVKPTTATRKGDYLPLVFLLTDGIPSDGIEAAVEAVERPGGTRIGTLYCIGCGEDVDLSALHRLGDAVFQLDEMTEEQIGALFMWLTASVRSASVAVAQTGGGAGPLDLSKLPDSVWMVPKDKARTPDPEPKVMIMKGMCSTSGRPYLMRYVRWVAGGSYRAVSSHPIEVLEDAGEAGQFDPVASSRLDGVAPCAHCANDGAGVCGACGTLFCLPYFGSPFATCPSCERTMRLGEGTDFQIPSRSD